MASVTTATEMEFRALLARVRGGPDEAAAAAVTAFVGDINVCPVDETVLHVAVYCGRPLTIAALAARGDCNPNITSWFGKPMLFHIAGWRSYQTEMATLMAHFPTLNVDACDTDGYTPLHRAALCHFDTSVRLLLDAGADPTKRTVKGLTPAQAAQAAQVAHGYLSTPRYFRNCVELLEAAEAWHNSLRRGWLRAVVGISTSI